MITEVFHSFAVSRLENDGEGSFDWLLLIMALRDLHIRSALLPCWLTGWTAGFFFFFWCVFLIILQTVWPRFPDRYMMIRERECFTLNIIESRHGLMRTSLTLITFWILHFWVTMHESEKRWWLWQISETWLVPDVHNCSAERLLCLGLNCLSLTACLDSVLDLMRLL